MSRGRTAATLVGMAGIMFALMGCGGGAPDASSTSSTSSTSTTSTPTPSTSTTTTAPPGPVAFVEWAKTAELGDRDPSQASDEALLNIGNLGCDVMATSTSFGQAVQDVVERLKDAGVTAGQMDAWLRQSVINLCPQHKDLLP